MYFPYLRGRQFELIALRELVENSVLSNRIVTIVEPVKLSSTLIKTIQVFAEAKKNLALVQNPQIGTFNSDCANEENKSLKEKLQGYGVIATYHVNEHFRDDVSGSLRDKSSVVAICKNKDSIPIYEQVFSVDKPLYSLMPDEAVFRRRIPNNRVMANDRFNKQNRNVDYAQTDDEPFSDDHLYYDLEGWVGFSDYSVIGDEYEAAGFAPYAVAIHIVYFDKDKSLRVKHFVSDSNDDYSDPAGKFAEAVRKLVKWNGAAKLDTMGMKKFAELHSSQTYPGLGTVKKLSIMHHIELMGRFLDEKREQ